MTVEGILLARYDIAVRRATPDEGEDEPSKAVMAFRQGYLRAVQDILDDMRKQPQPAPAPTGAPLQPRTLAGKVLGPRLKAIAEDVMDAMEAEAPGGGQ